MTDNSLHSKVDGYGFERPKDFDYKKYEEFMSAYLTILTRRAMKWSRLIGQKDMITKSRTVKRYCRKGIPVSSRPMVWMCITGAQVRFETNPHLYTQMVSAAHKKDLMETIKMDIHRTYPDNLYFATAGDSSSLQKPLYNVLIALGHKNSSIGYCQGMNFIAALLLLVMKSEEKVFWLMDTLFNNILPDHYLPDMKAVKIEQEVLGEVVKWKAPEIYNHLESVGMSWLLVGMKWFICLFADVMPVDTILRIWDALFYEGDKILIRASLALILMNKEKIMECRDFSQITNTFKNIVMDTPVLHCHEFVETMFKGVGSLPSSRINKLRKMCEANT